MVRILLLIDYSSEFDRKLLRGLVRYSKEHGPWIFYRLPSYYSTIYGSEGVMKWVQKWKPDAIIGQWNAETDPLLEELQIPIVLQNYHNRSSKYSNLTGDYKNTGRMAAKFFAERMYQNFAYFGVKGVVWSDERGEGFHQEALKYCGNFSSFEAEKEDDETREQVIRWLRSLPKPVALFCCDDAHALFISETCKMCNIAIPNDISLLGVDNDELICNISDPPISSINLEVETGGYMLGQSLHLRITKELDSTFNIVINPTYIEMRQSTNRHNIKDKNVLWIVEYIEKHYKEDLDIEELINLVPLSRRNIELKFKKIMHFSIYQYMLLCRVNHMAQALLHSERSVLQIAMEAGFRDSNFSRVFKKFKGFTPLEYKKHIILNPI